MLQPDRADKIRALLDSPIAGERDAASAALGRIVEVSIPVVGTKEWREAIRDWSDKIEFCVSRLGTADLTAAEVVTVRNVAKNRGDPWSRGADDFMRIYERLRAAEGHD
jgi:hypothetical protein